MDIVKILLATLTGTTLMTAFSYLVSEAYNKLFKEPVLLQIMLRLLHVEANDNTRLVLGWLIHYIIGLFFVLGYEVAWNHFDIEITWISALIFGAISGILGIIGWIIIFSLPSKKPRVHFAEYYLQLFFAHLIFALGAWIIYEIYQ